MSLYIPTLTRANSRAQDDVNIDELQVRLIDLQIDAAKAVATNASQARQDVANLDVEYMLWLIERCKRKSSAGAMVSVLRGSIALSINRIS